MSDVAFDGPRQAALSSVSKWLSRGSGLFDCARSSMTPTNSLLGQGTGDPGGSISSHATVSDSFLSWVHKYRGQLLFGCARTDPTLEFRSWE